MKLNAIKLSFAAALATAIVWTVCTALIAILPANMMSLSGHMVHANLTGMNWLLTWSGYFAGLVLWSLIAASIGWMIAIFYNWQSN